MMTTKKEYSLLEAINEVGAQIDPDVDVITVKVVGPASAPIVRVYIDHPNGVSFDVLCNTQKWIGEILDKINPFSGAYTLEVSSPGPERPLTKPKHYVAAIGKMAKIKTTEQVENRKAFTGTIISANDEQIEIALDEGKAGSEPHIVINYDVIVSANLKADNNW